jgi:hypothetical protein
MYTTNTQGHPLPCDLLFLFSFLFSPWAFWRVKEQTLNSALRLLDDAADHRDGVGDVARLPHDEDNPVVTARRHGHVSPSHVKSGNKNSNIQKKKKKRQIRENEGIKKNLLKLSFASKNKNHLNEILRPE